VEFQRIIVTDGIVIHPFARPGLKNPRGHWVATKRGTQRLFWDRDESVGRRHFQVPTSLQPGDVLEFNGRTRCYARLCAATPGALMVVGYTSDPEQFPDVAQFQRDIRRDELEAERRRLLDQLATVERDLDALDDAQDSTPPPHPPIEPTYHEDISGRVHSW
jgi:hypothetical protein